MVIRALLLAGLLLTPSAALAEEAPAIGPSSQGSGGTLQPAGTGTLQPQNGTATSEDVGNGLQSSADQETVRQWLAGDTIGEPTGAPDSPDETRNWRRDAALAGASVVLLLGLLWFWRGLRGQPVPAAAPETHSPRE